MIVRRVLALFVLTLVAFSSLAAAPVHEKVYAAAAAPGSGCAGDAEERSILGIPTWDDGLQNCDNITTDDILSSDKNTNPAIIVALNISRAIVSLIGILAVIFVIVGGFKYVGSDGSPDKATDARQTIINALIGAGIAASARIVLDWVHTGLTGTGII